MKNIIVDILGVGCLIAGTYLVLKGKQEPNPKAQKPLVGADTRKTVEQRLIEIENSVEKQLTKSDLI